MVRDLSIALQMRCANLPQVSIGLDDEMLCGGQLDDTYYFTADLRLEDGEHVLWVRAEQMQPDQMLEIEHIIVEGMQLDRVKWQGIYEPQYPEPWASQQGNLPQFRQGETYMGWDGVWRLRFTTPIFTWLHGVEHLGWLYV